MGETIDSYIDSRDYLDSDGIRTQEHKNRWALLSANALRLAKGLDITYLLTSSEILNTVIRKQKDYGHKNISKFDNGGEVKEKIVKKFDGYYEDYRGEHVVSLVKQEDGSAY